MNFNLDILTNIINKSPISIVVTDLIGNIVYVNEKFLDLTGYTKDEIIGENSKNLKSGNKTQEEYELLWNTILNGQTWVGEFINKKKNGETYYEKASITPIYEETKIKYFIALKEDITIRKRQEIEIDFLNKMYSVLSETNQNIIRCKNEKTLFENVCKICVDIGGMKNTWFATKENDIIVPVSKYGVDKKEIIRTKIQNKKNILSLCKNVFKTKQEYISNQRNLECNYGSIGIFPIKFEKKIKYLLIICHEEESAFNDKVTDIFKEMVIDLSFALETLKIEDEKNKLTKKFELLAQVFEKSKEGIVITDENTKIITINKAFTNITGYHLNEIKNKTTKFLSSGIQDSNFYKKMWNDITTHNFWQGEIKNKRKNGEIYSECLSIIKVKDKYKKVTNFIGIFSDVTERKEQENKIKLLAYYDTLTNLPNRSLFSDRVNQLIKSYKLTKKMFALIYIDIDKFKNINDTLGHNIGDKLLKEISKRLQINIRESDTISRVGGDEFVLLLPNTNETTTEKIAIKLLDIINKPYFIENNKLVVTPSIGISLYPKNGKDLETLLKSADLAMYKSKKDGRNNYSFFMDELQQQSIRNMELELDLRNALEHNEFFLLYQPLISLETNDIIGVEALLRWQHPKQGLISPIEFIPIAEETELIIPIGEWVLKKAIEDIKKINEITNKNIKVSINVSSIQLKQNNFQSKVSKIIKSNNIDPNLIDLELTESTMMLNPKSAIEIMQKFRNDNINVSIDDFGTGYSSLAYLKQFPITKIKIDKSFITAIGKSNEDEIIIKVIIDLVKTLNFKVLAEGVEDKEQYEFLKTNVCNEIQGYFFSKPLLFDDLIVFIKNVKTTINNLIKG